MAAQFRMAWVYVRDSLWFVPGAMTALAVLLAFVVTTLEEREVLASLTGSSWVFAGGAEGARGVLNAIAGGLITVTGVVFSVTIVALQLASSQFTPRVLRNFTADRVNQVVLGVFIGTFTYSLLVLRTIRSPTEDGELFVPRLAVTLGVLFVLVSIGFLIYFINHSARSIQVAEIVDRVTKRTLRHIERLYPEHEGREEPMVVPALAQSESTTVSSIAAGYVQSVDERRLFRLGEERDLVVAMQPRIGDFVLPGQPLVTLHPGAETGSDLCHVIRSAFVLGPERTPEQDVEAGLIEIVDIAVKALSPGINDPTTACQCVDRLAEILVALGNRAPPPPERTEHGRIHFIARPQSFDTAAALAFDQVRHFGASNPVVASRLVRVLASLVELLPESRRAVLETMRDAVLRDARREIESQRDRELFEQLAATLAVRTV